MLLPCLILRFADHLEVCLLRAVCAHTNVIVPECTFPLPTLIPTLARMLLCRASCRPSFMCSPNDYHVPGTHATAMGDVGPSAPSRNCRPKSAVEPSRMADSRVVSTCCWSSTCTTCWGCRGLGFCAASLNLGCSRP